MREKDKETDRWTDRKGGARERRTEREGGGVRRKRWTEREGGR